MKKFLNRLLPLFNLLTAILCFSSSAVQFKHTNLWTGGFLFLFGAVNVVFAAGGILARVMKDDNK